jgi:AcrR family transcriptional regulator
MKKKVNKKHTGGRSRERIVNEAVKLFARQGFAGTGMRELATAADVNLAMINYFFGSKKALLKEILNTFLTEYLAIARRELSGEDALQTKLKRFIHTAIAFFETHREYLVVTITELPHDDPEIIEYRAIWGNKMIEVIDREICKPLAAETGNIIPPTVFGPILTSTMASRFLFSPVMERVRPDEAIPVLQQEYSETISRLLLKMVS